VKIYFKRTEHWCGLDEDPRLFQSYAADFVLHFINIWITGWKGSQLEGEKRHLLSKVSLMCESCWLFLLWLEAITNCQLNILAGPNRRELTLSSFSGNIIHSISRHGSMSSIPVANADLDDERNLEMTGRPSIDEPSFSQTSCLCLQCRLCILVKRENNGIRISQ